MTDTDHLALCRAVFSGDWHFSRRILDEHTLDVAAMLDFLRRNHLAGQFAMSINESSISHLFPAALVHKLQELLRSQVQHNTRVLNATRHSIGILQDNDIPVILLKGVYYAEKFSGGLARRFLWDVDLLVQSRHRERATICLLKNDYQSKISPLWNNCFTRQLVHAVSLEKDNIEIDLHWHLRNRPAYRIDYQAVWNTRQPFQIDTDQFEVLSDEFNLLMLLLAIAHDLESGKLKLKLFFDLAAVLATLDEKMDWNDFFATRKSERLDTICINILTLVMVLLKAEERLPCLASALHPRRASVVIIEPAKIQRLISNPRQSLENRRWYASLYPGGRLSYALWWSSTLPLRYAIGRRF